jgi:hypothetical protein
MKNRINAVLVVLLVISGVAITGLSIDKQNATKEMSERDETIAQLRNDNVELGNRLYKAMATKIDTATKVIQTQKATLKIDSEDQCKATADQYFSTVQTTNNGYTRSTYRSHWNTNLKGCLIEMTIRKANSDGSISTLGIYTYDITHEKQISVCASDHMTANATSCDDSIFTTFQEMDMSQ